MTRRLQDFVSSFAFGMVRLSGNSVIFDFGVDCCDIDPCNVRAVPSTAWLASVSKVIVKTDQEPSIKFLVRDIVDSRPQGQTVLEESPVKSSGSNGKIERGIKGLEGQLRALLLGMERRLGRELNAEEPIVTFMPEYAAYLLNHRETGGGGKTAYERNKGRKASVLGIELGEKLLYNVRPKTLREKTNSRWEHGIFV